VDFNPDLETDPTYQKFIAGKPPPESLIIEANWMDNPFFPEELKKEKDYLYTIDPELAEHIWGGKIRRESNAQIFKGKWMVESFGPDKEWDGPYFGADFGFARDPAILTKSWICPGAVGPKLMIEYCACGFGVETNDLPEMYDTIPGSREYKIRGDNSRPETISQIKGKGFNIEACPKWNGSIVDGIAFLKSFEQIVIHPRCLRMIDEAKGYSYKTDRLTGDILPEIVDALNDGWDSVRYALNPLIQKSKNHCGKFSANYIQETCTISGNDNLSW